MLFEKLLCAALLALLPLAVHAEEEIGPETGQPSPNLIGRTLKNDQPYRLNTDQGNPKVINFFWIECKPCREEMPELAQLEKQYANIKFIAVHTQKETPDNIRKFIGKLPGAPSNIVLTSGGIQETFRYLGLPHTVVLDSNNIVLLNLVGYTPDNLRLLKKTLQQLAAK